MRRFRDRQQATLFRPSERMRLMTMVVMLGVIFLLMGRAKDPGTWKYFAGEKQENNTFTMAELERAESRQTQLAQRAGLAPDGPGEPGAPVAVTAENEDAPDAAPAQTGKPANHKDGQPSPEAPATADETEPDAKVPGAAEHRPGRYDPQPLDLDPEQRELLRRELEAVDDKKPFGPEEMFAYWRLVRWQYGQTTESLAKRARKDVQFSQLWHRPEKYRGELIRLRLHVRQTIKYDDEENHLPGVKQLFQTVGYTDESRGEFYTVVYTDLPSPDMPMGPDILEEAIFYGYFIKLMPFQDRTFKQRATPVLIGRLVWIPTPKVTKNTEEWKYAMYIAGGLVLLFGVRFGLKKFLLRRSAEPQVARGIRLNDRGEEVVPVETWLERVEEPGEPDPDEPPINGHSPSEVERNGNGSHRRFTAGLDWSEDPEK